MLALSQLKALLEEHNLYRCYINKDEAIALLLEKGIITPTVGIEGRFCYIH